MSHQISAQIPLSGRYAETLVIIQSSYQSNEMYDEDANHKKLDFFTYLESGEWREGSKLKVKSAWP